MRYRSDIRSLLFITLSFAMMLLAAVTHPGWRSLLIVPIYTMCAFTCCIINHNHMHCPIFLSERANRVFNIFLALVKGHTVQTVIVPHNRNHHVFHGGESDWITAAHAGSGSGPRRLLRYVLRSTVTMIRERRKEKAPMVPLTHKKAMFEQRLAILLFAFIVLLWHPGAFAFHLLLPWGAAMAMLVAVNLLQHDGCDLSSDVNRARNFTGRFGNWILFNNGYHAVHHLHPGMHWSLLKQLHDTDIAPVADPTLQEPSLLGFLLGEYIFERGIRSIINRKWQHFQRLWTPIDR